MSNSDRGKLVDVYVGYPIENSYTYTIPNGLQVEPGMRVLVNFRNRIVTAFTHRVHNSRPKGVTLKEISEVIDPVPIFDARLIELAEDVAADYICSIGEVLSMALPSGKGRKQRYKGPVFTQKKREIKLTENQKQIYKDIISQQAEDSHHLVFGITGSGKTELYIEIARYIIQQNQSVIYLVPEISLSSQIFERVFNVFGEELILYHSRLTPNQRLNNWIKFYMGEARIAVGTRSSVFLQCPKLGLIVIDEEHDGSYKENSTPRYNARRIAMCRCKRESSILVMGSATPSIESLHAAERGVFRLHFLKERYGRARLPEIEIVKVKPAAPADMLSPILRLHSKRAIEQGNQVIYFLNRRGFSPILVCNECGDVVECPHCSISMNYHHDGLLHCHYCGYKAGDQKKCSKCDSEDMVKLGSGTQRLEEIIHEVLVNARVFRLDQDSSRERDAVFKLIEKMNKGEIDILVGTQMVAKGFDFHRVSTVGVIMADIGLNLPDFRSSERIFALLMQVAGRSGRGKVPGRVIIQTLNDENYIYTFLKNNDYYGFYRHELSMRRESDYPPFSRITRLLIRGSDERRVKELIDTLHSTIYNEIKKRNSEIKLLGPSQAPIAKIAGKYRYHILLKSRDLNQVREIIRIAKNGFEGKKSYLEIDIDPYENDVKIAQFYLSA